MTAPPPTEPAPAARRARWRDALIVFAAVFVAHVWLLGSSPLARTEGLRAMVAHHTLEQNAWLAPRLWDRIYLRKPPMVTWLMAGSEALFGVAAEWVWRLPSVLMTAMLAAFLCAMGRRWFGPPAGLVSGLALLALVPLWSQSRSAEIDATNTALSVAVACVLLELGFGAARRRWLWSMAGGLALAAALLSKGPACAPLVAAALVGPAVATRRWRWLLRPTLWGALLLGAALAAAWAAAVWVTLPPGETSRALAGVREVATRSTLFSAAKWFAVLTLPLALAAASFPLIAALPAALHPATRRTAEPAASTMITALAATFIAAMALGVIAMLDRPRYGYVALPMLCPLAGAVAAAWAQGRYTRQARLRLRQFTTAVVFVVLALHVTLVALSWRSPALRIAAVALTVVALVAFAWTLRCWLRQRVRAGAVGLCIQLVLASLAFSIFKTYERAAHEPDAPARLLKATVQAGPVYAGQAMADRAQLFYYAGVGVRTPPSDPAASLPDNAWLVLNAAERHRYARALGPRLQPVTELIAKDLHLYVMRYHTAPAPAPTLGCSQRGDEL